MLRGACIAHLLNETCEQKALPIFTQNLSVHLRTIKNTKHPPRSLAVTLQTHRVEPVRNPCKNAGASVASPHRIPALKWFSSFTTVFIWHVLAREVSQKSVQTGGKWGKLLEFLCKCLWSLVWLGSCPSKPPRTTRGPDLVCNMVCWKVPKDATCTLVQRPWHVPPEASSTCSVWRRHSFKSSAAMCVWETPIVQIWKFVWISSILAVQLKALYHFFVVLFWSFSIRLIQSIFSARKRQGYGSPWAA